MATIEAENLEIIKGSETLQETNPEGATFLGYKEINGAQTTVQVDFSQMTPLFGVSQEVGTSITLAPSEAAVKGELNLKADKTDTNGNDVQYAPEDLYKKLYGSTSGTETESIPYSGAGSGKTSSSYGYFAYTNNSAIQGKRITRIKVNIFTAGTFTVAKFKDTPDSTEILWSRTFNVSIGENNLSLNIDLASDELLAFVSPTDTAVMIWNRITPNSGFYTNVGTNQWASNAEGDLTVGVFTIVEEEKGDIQDIYNQLENLDSKGFAKQVNEAGENVQYAPVDTYKKLYGADPEGETESITYSETGTGKTVSSYGYFSYQNNSVIQGKHITRIKAYIETAGTFTVAKFKSALNSTNILWYRTFNVSQGENNLSLNIDLASDEILAFVAPTDTAVLRWDNVTTPKVGFYTGVGTTNWSLSNEGNLTVGIYTGSIVGQKGDIPYLYEKIEALGSPVLKDKTFSVLGDSIDTFEGYIPAGNETYYPRFDVTDYNKTWWGVLIEKYGMKLVLNNSWSGGRVCGTLPASFGSRATNLGDNPEYIFIKGGTNDFTDVNPIGEYNWNNVYDRSQFRQALCYTIEQNMNAYPNSKLIYLIPPGRTNNGSNVTMTFPPMRNGVLLSDYLDCIREVCDMYGVNFIDLSKCVTFFNSPAYLGDGLHPNATGMAFMADFIAKNINI